MRKSEKFIRDLILPTQIHAVFGLKLSAEQRRVCSTEYTTNEFINEFNYNSNSNNSTAAEKESAQELIYLLDS